MLFVMIVFVLLWVFEILFLQSFYVRTKTSDIISLADDMKLHYEKDGYEAEFSKLATDNEMCIVIYDAVNINRKLYSKDIMGINCVLHGLENESLRIIRQVKSSESGEICYKYFNEKANVDILIYASVIGDADHPKGYLLLNTPLAPVYSTVSILKRQLLIVCLLLMVFAVLISLVVSKILSRPIVQVTKDAEQLAHGRYDIVFQGGGYAEAEQLAQTLTYASREINRIDMMQRDLVANASHDLRTPLTMLKAYAEMIRDLSGDNPVKRAEHLQVIIEETDRLTLLVNDILDLSKLENGKLSLNRSEFDIEQKLTDIIERYCGLSGVSGYTFVLETDGSTRVNCDAGKIEQVICNLINNAMNYSVESKRILVKQERFSDGIRISVCDEGQGMDQETVSKIFDKYYRSENYKREVVGTGLGLSIVKAILRLHDYAFGVDSTLGIGSTFWFEIHKDDILS